MKNDNQMTDEMLVRYILGEASLQERLSVQEWLSVNRENKNRLDELTLIWKESGKLAVTSSVTTEEAWERFKGHIGKTTHSTNRQARAFYWLKAAAILLLLAGGGWFSWVNMQTVETAGKPITSSQTAPGSFVTEPSTTTASSLPASAPDTEIITKKEPAEVIKQKKKDDVAGRKKMPVSELHKKHPY